MILKETIATYFQQLQDSICQALQQADGKGTFREDHWQRPGGGGGRSRTIQNGAIIEKGGVGFSAVHGQMHEQQLRSLNITEKADFFATGVSIVIHPHSPMVPIIHMNVRYFEMSNGTCWFGGGIDLTPHYVVPKMLNGFTNNSKPFVINITPIITLSLSPGPTIISIFRTVTKLGASAAFSLTI